MVSALILVTEQHGIASAEAFGTALGTVLVFWLAHLFAGTLARLSISTAGTPDIHDALALALRHSIGLLLGLLGYLVSRGWTRIRATGSWPVS
ncbi:hypothetical protein [Paeniglutamicibacter cryotolerans]|uniref:Uncharacterized protein n=1 Tax=Paeniglutamicibacter cryotolerans TaxID=670079 RepID=A0A839QE53_9MICC|nr:hypothetical protein [Paeniglutamicibacter cryotolerans]MBB2993873.1 hypothetical protein [Paeniglutamicibacter cryotolerans]